MAIKTYAKGTSTKLSENFKSHEFACKGTSCGCTTVQVDTDLVDILQKIRDHFGKPVEITSGYRCAKHNKSVGGATKSYHAQGRAADIQVEDIAPREVAKYAESIGVKGVGLYETAADGYFVHVDTRTEKYYWYGQAQAYRTTFGGSVQTSSNKESNKESDKAGAKPTLTVTLRLKTPRMVGDNIAWLQKRLNELGYSCGDVDGIFGPATKAAVVKFQKAKGLSPDGQCGKKTWAKL